MKKLILFVFSISVVITLLSGGPHQVTIKYPSDLLAGGAKGTTSFSLDFVLRPIGDFRLMYCDEQTLKTRLNARVCVLDFDSPEGRHKEVQALSESTLGDILKKSGVRRLENWDGRGQPSIRIISKRAILAHDGTDQFLQRKVSPGDFVIVGSTY